MDGRPIANQYCEGKVKSTADSGVKKNLKPYAYKRSEPACPVTACLLDNEPTSCFSAARLRTFRSGAEAKASTKHALSCREQTRNLVIYPCPG